MIENINWYPGHMKKTRDLLGANLKLVDVVLEVVDARIPLSSRNPLIEEISGEKARILILNKSDLADPQQNKAWAASLQNALILNSVSGDGLKSLLSRLDGLQAKRNSLSKRNRPLRLMAAGIPNVGKSSLINRLVGRKSAKTGDRPGVTRGKQWLSLENGMQLLDTPGILWPKFEDPKMGINLAFCGSIKDEIMDLNSLALELIGELCRGYPDCLISRNGIGAADIGLDSPLATMDAIALKRGFILPGKRIDYDRTARAVLDEFRSGKIGRITLEKAADLGCAAGLGSGEGGAV